MDTKRRLPPNRPGSAVYPRNEQLPASLYGPSPVPDQSMLGQSFLTHQEAMDRFTVSISRTVSAFRPYKPSCTGTCQGFGSVSPAAPHPISRGAPSEPRDPPAAAACPIPCCGLGGTLADTSAHVTEDRPAAIQDPLTTRPGNLRRAIGSALSLF